MLQSVSLISLAAQGPGQRIMTLETQFIPLGIYESLSAINFGFFLISHDMSIVDIKKTDIAVGLFKFRSEFSMKW